MCPPGQRPQVMVAVMTAAVAFLTVVTVYFAKTERHGDDCKFIQDCDEAEGVEWCLLDVSSDPITLFFFFLLFK